MFFFAGPKCPPRVACALKHSLAYGAHQGGHATAGLSLEGFLRLLSKRF